MSSPGGIPYPQWEFDIYICPTSGVLMVEVH